MAKKKHRSPKEEYGFSCSWCRKAIPDDVELFSVGAKARPKYDISDREGETIEIFLNEAKNVQAIVVTSDSPAKKHGYDMLFVACSERCADELRDAVGKEI